MNEPNPTEIRALRATAHHLNPVVSISQKGLTAGVLNEIDRSLKAHELIKVRLYGIDREARPALIGEICTALKCIEVQHIGNLLVLWRPRPVDASEKSALATRRSPRGVPKTKKQAATAIERKR
jgi:RNA-binding protein